MKVESITLYVNGTEYRFSVGTMFGQLPPVKRFPKRCATGWG
ncbi:hypothetical protein [Caproicibacter fermentans]